MALRFRFEPNLIEVVDAKVRADQTKRMEIGFSDPVPVRKFDTELERRMYALDEMLFVDAEILDELDKRWDGGFADSDGPYFFRLHKFNFEHFRPKVMRQY